MSTNYHFSISFFSIIDFLFSFLAYLITGDTMYFKYKKERIVYEKFGEGKNTIILLPGWGEVRNTYSFIIDYFKQNFVIYYIHYPGFGGSKCLNEEFTIYDYGEFVHTFLKRKKIINPIIIAHSFGGRITSLLLGKYHYPCHKVILMDVAGIKHFSLKLFFQKSLYKILKKLTYLFPICCRKRMQKKLFSFFSSSDYSLLPDSMKKTFQNIVKENLKKYYKRIPSNVLILWGDKDIDTPLKDAYILNHIIPNSGLVIYKNSSHFAYLQYPYLTNCIIEEFIKEKQV